MSRRQARLEFRGNKIRGKRNSTRMRDVTHKGRVRRIWVTSGEGEPADKLVREGRKQTTGERRERKRGACAMKRRRRGEKRNGRHGAMAARNVDKMLVRERERPGSQTMRKSKSMVKNRERGTEYVNVTRTDGPATSGEKVDTAKEKMRGAVKGSDKKRRGQETQQGAVRDRIRKGQKGRR